MLLLPLLFVLGWVATSMLYQLSTLLHDVPLREPSVRDGLTGVALYLAFYVLHEGAHAVTVRALGGRIVRFGIRVGGAHVVHAGLMHRPGARALVSLAGPVVHLVAAAALAVLAVGDDWSRTEHAAVLAVAVANIAEAVANLVPWRGRRRCSDGWRALAHTRELVTRRRSR
ncbi:hypothetical protein [Quadrisphaera sp. DSM 44207]|uniref:hypothetical protein n=1 Tax=Quadrisphaera sp. DSM 44207 TaxID=1881057 RepID=UPI00115F98FE|nr:hypothetical protein [Quadrisphaera sp. DSM 44207]